MSSIFLHPSSFNFLQIAVNSSSEYSFSWLKYSSFKKQSESSL
ncbi:hypothetical protein [Clostridium perfringens]|nr:hypothetical protein [Clostridium perfringens]